MPRGRVPSGARSDAMRCTRHTIRYDIRYTPYDPTVPPSPGAAPTAPGAARLPTPSTIYYPIYPQINVAVRGRYATTTRRPETSAWGVRPVESRMCANTRHQRHRRLSIIQAVLHVFVHPSVLCSIHKADTEVPPTAIRGARPGGRRRAASPAAAGVPSGAPPSRDLAELPADHQDRPHRYSRPPQAPLASAPERPAA